MLASIMALYREILEETVECINLTEYVKEKDPDTYNFIVGKINAYSSISEILRNILVEEGVFDVDDKKG